VLESLAVSARGVFDADVAVVTLTSGAGAPLEAVAARDRLPRVGDPAEPLPTGLGVARPEAGGDWLAAPVHDGLEASRGTVAIVRRDAEGFTTEEREILALLGRLAATTLRSIDLTRAIARSEARLRTIVESAPVGLVEVDDADQVIWWNGSAARILRWPAHAAAESAPEFPAEARGALRELWRRARTGGPSVGPDLDDVLLGGHRRQLTLAAAPLAGGADSVLTLLDDVTETRQLRAELRHAHTMEVRGQVASRVAHDFNNLITLISGYAEMLSRELAGDEAHLAMVRDIQATASRASLLTGQLQTIGRTKATEPVVFNPVTVIASNAEVLERVLGARIELALELDPAAGAVLADADQFEQLVLNLSINARDAMPAGGHLTLRLVRETLDDEAASALEVEPGEYVRLDVADDGEGMDEETRRRCFEPLFTTKGTFRGTGMGLASAQRLVSASDGAISVVSALGEGTTFFVRLPRVGDASAEEARVEVARPRGEARVLVADDDEGLRRLMSQVLRRNGYEVVEVDSAEAALVAADDAEFDLLVSDVVMAEVSGEELARRLQSRRPGLRVLLVSGTADAHVVAHLSPGTAAFLAKPFRPSEVIDRAHELLAKREG
jgi:PAS domain S-box-containing protein